METVGNHGMPAVYQTGDGTCGSDERAAAVCCNREKNDAPSVSREEKNRQLFLRQKKLLDLFLEKGAISRAQHDKSLHDLRVKMGMDSSV